MPVVTVRDARPEDTVDISEVWATAMPHLVRSQARALADLRCDRALGRRRYVGLLGGRVVGTSTSRRTDERTVFLTVEVRPDAGSRGVGTALLEAAGTGHRGAEELVSVCRDDAISLAFSVRNGFLPEGENRVSRVDPAAVDRVGPVPAGLTATSLDRLGDLDLVLSAHNDSAADDPTGLSRPYSPEAFRADWWESPDNAPELSWALLDSVEGRPVVVGFSSVQVDRSRARAWSGMTATRTAYRGRGLARWVKGRSLNALADARITEALTEADASNQPMLAVDEALGYRPTARTIRVRRRLHH